MCPACMASAALMAGSVSTGGIAALAVMVRGKKRGTKEVQNENSKNVTERRNGDGNNDDNKQNRTGDGSAVR